MVPLCGLLMVHGSEARHLCYFLECCLPDDKTGKSQALQECMSSCPGSRVGVLASVLQSCLNWHC